MTSESLGTCYPHHWRSPPSSDSTAKKVVRPQFSVTKKDPCATTNDKQGQKERKWGGDQLATCLGAEESQRVPASCSPSQCANHRAAASRDCPGGGGPPLPGCGSHMAMESIWQTGCGYCGLEVKQYDNTKTLEGKILSCPQAQTLL